ncbi:MAG: hypothetical protein AVO38_03505 [delta proteobacterium ML8_D]|nr:MAG: hypothetical protein AVO38_03505 [delta proteobacterium ML8_D]
MITGMIDCHCHILPQIDDGASNIEVSLEMAKIASADGIRKIIATPHISDNFYSPADIKNRVNRLNRYLAENQVPVLIYPAAEVSIALDISLFSQYTMNHTAYILIEFPHDYLPPFAPKLLAWILARGLTPIIAHPERNFDVIQNPDSFIDLLHTGIYTQITGGSLTGDFGTAAQHCAAFLLDAGVVDIIASDAHSSRIRPPVLSKAVEVASARIGQKAALKLVRDNPTAVLTGKKCCRNRQTPSPSLS